MVTNENYYSKELSRKYMGYSQFKNFVDCEARALAELNDEWTRPSTTSLLVGSYVDSYFEGTIDLFKAKHQEIFKRDGTLKAEYLTAEKIINRIESDELFLEYITGETQSIMTGNIAGVPFKIKMDSYHPGACIVDLKCLKDMNKVYKDGVGYVSFIEAWGYHYQAAIYREIEGNNLPFVFAVATKEPVTNIELIGIRSSTLDRVIEEVKNRLPRIMAVKNGVVPPTRCGKCDYCKSTKVIEEIIYYEDMEV